MGMEWEKSTIIHQIIMDQELSRHSRILTGDIVCLSEDTKSSKRDIFEITDGCGDDT